LRVLESLSERVGDLSVADTITLGRVLESGFPLETNDLLTPAVDSLTTSLLAHPLTQPVWGLHRCSSRFSPIHCQSWVGETWGEAAFFFF
jgi:hypothetical protein